MAKVTKSDSVPDWGDEAAGNPFLLAPPKNTGKVRSRAGTTDASIQSKPLDSAEFQAAFSALALRTTEDGSSGSGRTRAFSENHSLQAKPSSDILDFFSGAPSVAAPPSARGALDEESDSDSSDSSSDEERLGTFQEEEEEEEDIVKHRKADDKGEAGVGETKKADAASATPKKNPNNKAVDMNVLPLLKKGYSFMKFGKYGRPHFRLVQLSDDQCRLVWYSKKKGKDDTTVWLNDITELRLGQKTEIFHKNPTPSLVRTSFSVIYGRNNTTLDLISKSINEYNVFVEGLQQLLLLIKDRGVNYLKELKVLVLPVKQFLLKMDKPQHPGDKTDVVDYHEVKDVEQLLKKYKAKLQGYRSRPEYKGMKDLLTKLIGELSDANACRQDGYFDKCRHSLWKIRVDVKGLKHQMKAIKAETTGRGSFSKTLRRFSLGR